MATPFTPGQFTLMRATTTFHLGSIERDVTKDEIVEWDGTTLKLGDTTHRIPTVAAAVRAGWLVPASDTTSTYRPQAAQMTVRPATQQARDRGDRIDVRMVHDEERDLGNIKTVRDRGDGTPKRAMQVLAEDASSEGVAVGRISRPAVTRTKLTPENEMRAMQEIRQLSDTQGASTSSLVTPIQGARAAASLNELMGDDEVVVARIPPARESGLGEGDLPHLTAGEKEVRAEAQREAVESARQARREAALSAAEKNGIPRDAMPSAPAPTPDDGEPEALPPDIGQKVMFVRAVIPNFSWDMTRPWRARVADAVKTYGKNPLYLNGILSVETDTVKTHIAQAMSR